MSLFSAAMLGMAAASIGGRAAADPPRVVVHNGYTNDVVVTVTDLNTPNGVLLTNEQPLDPNADMVLNPTLDSGGVYNLHWKVQDTGRTKTQEGDCQATATEPCRVDLVLAP